MFVAIYLIVIAVSAYVIASETRSVKAGLAFLGVGLAALVSI